MNADGLPPDLAGALLHGAASLVGVDGSDLLVKALDVCAAAIGAKRRVLRLPAEVAGGDAAVPAGPHLDGCHLLVPIATGPNGTALLELDLGEGHGFAAEGRLRREQFAALAAFAALVAELHRSSPSPLDRHALALNQVAMAFARSQTVEEVTTAALHALESVFQPELCGAFIATDGPVTGFRLEAGTLTRRLGPWSVATLPDPLSAIYTVGEVRFYESAAQVVAEHGVGRCADPRFVGAGVHLPLVIDGVVAGGLGLQFGQQRRYREDERDLLLALAGLCAEALRRARGYEDERRRALRSESLHQVSEALSGAATVPEVAEVAVRGLSRALGSAVCAVSLLREGSPLPLASVGAAAPFDDGLAALVRHAGGPVWFDHDRPPPDGPFGQPSPWRAVVPFLIADEVTGWVAAGLPEGASWCNADRDLVETVSSLTGEALRRAELFEDATGAAQRYQGLFDSYESMFRRHPLAMVVIDERCERVLAANDAATALFESDVSSLLAQPFEELLHPTMRQFVLAERMRPVERPGGVRFHPLMRMQRASGTAFVAEATSTVVEFDGRPARLASISDQTAREHAKRDRASLQERVVSVAEEERRRISLDLHDGPVQDLAVVVMRLAALRRSLVERHDEVARRLLPLEAHTEMIVDVLRNLMQQLSPANLEERTLSELAADVIAAGPWATSLAIELDDRLAVPLPAPLKAALYRVLVEALTNVHKHASASTVHVTLAADDRNVELHVVDDGVGMGEADRGRSGHFGLSSMRDRVVMLGGRFTLEASPPGGTAVRAKVPRRVPQPAGGTERSALR